MLPLICYLLLGCDHGFDFVHTGKPQHAVREQTVSVPKCCCEMPLPHLCEIWNPYIRCAQVPDSVQEVRIS